MVEPAQLQKYSLFGGLLEEQIQKILPFLEKEEYEPAEDIIVEGTPNDRIRFILEGQVTVTKNNTPLYQFGTGDTVGEMEVLDVMPSAATIKTLTNTKVLSISNRGLREIYKTDIHSFSLIIMNLARDLSRRLRHMNDMLIEKSP
ncbi:MAG: cyclic nucleotide-binding domain-containing protein [Spirochaetaceae bacterium]|jgi:CRP-like cAMP-binding protein|nr:cyclic nucleotide-binding domain-containing protein [Spirochaetaceae bacterium]